jgi:hypothetical protein
MNMDIEEFIAKARFPSEDDEECVISVKAIREFMKGKVVLTKETIADVRLIAGDFDLDSYEKICALLQPASSEAKGND